MRPIRLLARRAPAITTSSSRRCNPYSTWRPRHDQHRAEARVRFGQIVGGSRAVIGDGAMTDAPRGGQQYDRHYFDFYGTEPVPYDRKHPEWLSFFGTIADHIV